MKTIGRWSRRLSVFVCFAFVPTAFCAAPIISSFVPASGATGSAVTVNGSNFGATPAANIVYFGAVRAAVTGASTSNLTATVPSGATYGPISDTVQGLTADSIYPFLPTFSGGSPLSSSSLSNSFNLNLGSGREPFGLVVGDLDGDGKPDVVAVNASDSTIWIYRNISSNGTMTAGSFAPPVILTSAPPVNVAGVIPALADLDGDGRLDIVFPNFDSGSVSVFQNLSTAGSLTFAPRVDYSVGSRPTAAAVIDLDGDGKPEIVVANRDSATLSVLKNLSTGGLLASNSFALAVTLATGLSPNQVVAADIDGDGKFDLVAANYGTTDGVSVFRNTSSGGSISFASRVDLSTEAGEEGLAVGDIDGDGKLDLIVGSYSTGNFSVYLNIGSAGSITANSFASPVIFSAGGPIHQGGIALGDIDGDGKPDVAVVDQNSGNMYLYRNLSSPGTFTNSSLGAPVIVPSGYNSAMVAIDDLDGDGQPDIVIANTYGNNLTIWQNASATLTITNPPPGCTQAPSDMAAWWRAEGNANDSINGNNGTINGGVSFGPGEVGQAFNFDGFSGYISVPASPSLNIGTGSGITIECWIQPNHLGPSYAQGRPIAEYDTPTAAGVHFWFEQNYTLYANVIDTSGVYHTISTAPGAIVTNALQHVAVTYDKSSGNCFLYVNGVQAASANFGNITPQTSYPLYIGDRAANGLPGSGSLYNGILDELSLYSRALSPSEIAAIYNAGSAGKCASVSGAAPTITSQPTSELVNVGQTASFTVTASGSPTLMYQWYDLSGSIAGATNATLTLSNVQLSATGSYYVTVSNPFGSTNSAAATLIVTNLPSSCTPAPSGMVGWWRAEGNALDSIGGNNGVITGAVSFATGEVGQAFHFTDTNEDIVIPASSNLNVGLGEGLTLEAWINPDNVTNYNPVFEWNPGDGINYWGVGMFVLSGSVYNTSPVPGTLYANVQGVGDVWHQLWSAPGTVTNGGFQHVALTYDKASGIATLYYNGAIVAQTTFGSFTPKTIANLHIGRRPIDPAGDRSTFGGLIDEASVYNRALSQSEIQSIYNAGSAGKCTSNSVPPVSGPPVITSINPTTGLAGSAVTITGSNFAATAAGDIVYFGAVQAAVTAGNTSSLTVIAPTNATFAPISVTVNGLTGYSEQFYLPDFNGTGPLTNSSFGSAFSLTTPNGPNRVYIADLDGDGRPDVLVANNYAGTISIFQNISSNGLLNAGSFAPRVDLVVGPTGGGADAYTLAVADLDGDGKLDIVALNADDSIVSIFRNISMPGILTSNSFAARIDLPGGNAMRGVAVQDLDGDGRPEIVIGSQQDNGISIYKNESTIGSIAFDARVLLHSDAGATTIAIGDLDGDGLPDIAVANYDAGTISVFRNLGFTGTINSNSFAAPVNFASPANPFGLALGDIDRDGKLDMVVSCGIGSSTLAVYRNTSVPGSINASSFASAVDFGLPGWGNFVALADLDGDGKLDIAVVTQLGDSFSLFRNISTPGSFTTASLAPRIDLPAGYNPNGVTIGDLNGDGRPDVVFANAYNNSLWVYQNVSLTGTNPPSCTPAPGGITAWWKAEGNALDSVGGNNGTLMNDAGFEPGEVNQAFSLDGATSYVLVQSANSSLNVGTGSGMTIEGWINPITVQKQQLLCEWERALGTFSGADVGVNFAIQASTQLYINIKDTSGNDHLIYSPANLLGSNTWQHVAMTYDTNSGIGALYINGALVISTNVGSFIPETSFTNFLIGGRTTFASVSHPVTMFGGGMDEWSLYNRALSQSELAAIYSAGTAGKCPGSANQPPVADASATESVVISPNGTNAQVLLDGSLSHDPDGDALQYEWIANGVAVGNGVTLQTILPVGTNQITLVVSDGISSNQQTIAVQVITIVQAIQDLSDLVTTDFSKAQSMAALLANAIKSVDKSNPTAAINQLQAFQNQVNAQVAPLDPALAQILVQDAQDIIDVLNGTPKKPAQNGSLFLHHANGHAYLGFSGVHQQSYSIEASSDLTHWTRVGSAQEVLTGAFEFEDLSSTNASSRFYRVVVP